MENEIPSTGTCWRHYKSLGGADHTYEVLGLSVHSETHEPLVRYRPLYEVPEDSWVYGYSEASRPLSLWYDMVECDGELVQRFTQLSVSEILTLGLKK